MTRIALCILLAGAATPLWFSAAASGEAPAACTDQSLVVISARTPEVDLFDAPTGGKRVASIPKAKFPTCLPILEQSPARMLKVDIEGTQYWVQPHMVTVRSDAVAPICRNLAEGTATSTMGTTRGLGEGC